MHSLEEKIRRHQFVITTELTPPKGTDLTELFAKADALRGSVDAINLTESARALMAVAPAAVARLLLERGLEPIVQMTSRDRNRIAVQADLLGGALLGVHNFVFMGGDPPTVGDHPEAKAVFDLTASQMLEAARALSGGHDLSGKPLRGSPALFVGATCNPGARDLEAEVLNTRRKIDAGARFLQTQAVFAAAALERFLEAVQPGPVAILTGIIPLKSAKMARWLNDKVPGIHVPEPLLRRLDAAQGPQAELTTGLELAACTLREVRPLSQGVHVMALGWEAHIPALLAQGGLRPAPEA